MRNIFLAVLFLPCWSFAAETINCHFDKFHQANHRASEMTGYAVIDKSIEILDGKTSEKTLKLDGMKRAANSITWILLKPKGWEKYSTTYAGDFGELLIIEYKQDEKSKSSNGWYLASLISSNTFITHTSLGKCTVK